MAEERTQIKEPETQASHDADHSCCHAQGEHGHDHHHQHGCGCGHEEEEGLALPWLIVSAVLFLVGAVLPRCIQLPSVVQAVWMAVAALLPLSRVILAAVHELKKRTMGENLLLVIAVAAAFGIGEYVEGTLVLLLFSLGEFLEDQAMDRSRRTIASLAAVTPDTAFRLCDTGEREEVPVEQVSVGDRLYIPPHGRVPVDCRILTGESAVDTAALTGESTPVYAAVNSELLSGTVNGSGELTAVALRRGEESAAARILHLVEESAARKGQAEKFITRFARWYTPIVTGLAVLVAAIPPLLLHQPFITWLYRALVFLVASCPCALVISIPLGFYAGIAAAAKRGVLLKGGCFVETLARIRGVAFDKTGTLTSGDQLLERTETEEGISEDRALMLAAALEKVSSHPAARAIVAAAGESCGLATQLEELPGQGVLGLVEGRELACGGRQLLEHLKIDAIPPAMEDASSYLVCEGRVIAAFFLTERLQEGSAATVAALKKVGVSRQAMLTGDSLERAQAVADAVGITEVHAGLRPEDKLAVVRRMQEEGISAAFVGDGINDAPVLAAADIGIAMGLGSASAIETADAVLVTGGLSHLPMAVKLCRRVVRIVRENIVFALAVKAAVLVLAVFGFAPMWLAVFADMGVTLLSVCNSLRLLWGGHGVNAR